MDESKKQFAIVVGLAKDAEGRILFQKRADPSIPEADGKWEFPGGKMHFGETPEAAVVREFREEVGCDVVVRGCLPVLQSRVWARNDGGENHAIVFCYEVEIVGGVPRPSDAKVSEVRWFLPDEALKLDALATVKKFIAMSSAREPRRKEYEAHDLKRGLDYIGVNVVFYCHDGAGKVLLHKRSQKCRDERGVWDCGAGAMEFGETFEDAVHREVAEEYGAAALEIEYVGTRNVLRTHAGRPTHWVKNLHWVRIDPAEARINDPEKIDEIGWFPLDAPPSPLHSQWGVEHEMLKKFLDEKSMNKEI